MRPPIARPLTFFILLLIAGGVLGAVGSFWWSARWYPEDLAESEHAAADGWHWLIAPAPAPDADGFRAESGGVLYCPAVESPGRLSVLLSVPATTPEKPARDYRLVGISASGERGPVVEDDPGGTGGGVDVYRFTLPGGREDGRFAKIGVEYRASGARADG